MRVTFANPTQMLRAPTAREALRATRDVTFGPLSVQAAGSHIHVIEKLDYSRIDGLVF
jgi:hypothetical protein